MFSWGIDTTCYGNTLQYVVIYAHNILRIIYCKVIICFCGFVLIAFHYANWFLFLSIFNSNLATASDEAGF